MKKILLILFIFIYASGGILNSTRAQTSPLPQETIVSYTGDIVVNTDNSIDVTETIIYNTGPSEHHGIYRDISPLSSQGRTMSFTNIHVSDENGSPYQFQISHVGKNTRIKIGDPNRTFMGQKTYIITYHATQAIAQLENFDEIYWNVTGNEWDMPIQEATATITLPSGTTALQSACYYGRKGSKTQCSIKTDQYGHLTFSAPSILENYEGLTVAAGFPKGIVTPYTAQEEAFSVFQKYWAWFVAGILPLLTLFIALRKWYRTGRDERKMQTIIPQYDVIDELTPLEVSGIVYEKVTAQGISAEIIYLATKGYLKIQELEEKTLGFMKTNDYELIKLKDYTDLPNEFDLRLMQGLFAGKERIKLSTLKNVFYTEIKEIIKQVLNTLLMKTYYKNLGRMRYGMSGFIVLVFLLVWGSIFFGGIMSAVILPGNIFVLALGVGASIIIYSIVYYFSPAKTEKGVAAKEYLLGLKDYLQIAEKDRLEFHNAPAKKPEIFEQLLPYAMILGVADIWAKEFEGIYTTPPSWYSGPSTAAFSAVSFSDSLNSFSSFASSSLSSSPSSSGSGGGGSSGGGGGGGGGGSW